MCFTTPKLNLKDCTIHCQIIEASVTPLIPNNTTGQVTGGHLLIECYLQELLVEALNWGGGCLDLSTKPVIKDGGPDQCGTLFCFPIGDLDHQGAIVMMPVSQGRARVIDGQPIDGEMKSGSTPPAHSSLWGIQESRYLRP